MKLTRWRPHRSGALAGFASVRLPCGLMLADCPVFSNGKATWANLPSKPRLDRDGRVVVLDGVRQYESIVTWPDRETHNRWSTATVDLVRAADPGAFGAVN